MTWLNMAARVGSLAIVLPLVLRRFSAGDVALYYLFSSLVSLQLLSTAGFIPTFSRFVSYALAGARIEDFEKVKFGGDHSVEGRPDVATFSRLVASMRRLFLWTALIVLPLIAMAGTLALRRPIEMATDPQAAWVAWTLIIVTSVAVIYGTQYSALLQGANRIAIDQRWAAIFALAASFSSIAVLSLGGGLLALIASSQIWQLVGLIRSRWLVSRLLVELPYAKSEAAIDNGILRAVWPGAWRSLVGTTMSAGIVQMSGLAFAQRLAAGPLAEFLFAQRMINLISEFSRAPFYSLIPRMNIERAKSDLATLSATAASGMRRSYLCYLVPFFVLSVVGPAALTWIGSSVAFPSWPLWCALGAAVLVERWGAMHIQLYSTTNTIIWHWLNGATGAAWIFLMWIAVPLIGIFAYPLGMLIAYLAIYTPISVWHSLRSIRHKFVGFEQSVFAPAAVAFFAGSALFWWVVPRR